MRTQHRVLLEVIVCLVGFDLVCARCRDGTGSVQMVLLLAHDDWVIDGENALEAVLCSSDEIGQFTIRR